MTAVLRLLLALAMLLAAGALAPAAAQVIYTDKAGITHFVESTDQVPEEYRSGAKGKSSSGAPPKPLTVSQQQDAIRYCHEMVLIYLKSPGSAQRAKSFYDPRTGDVIGEVDSQNSYGGLMRGLYKCRMNGVIATDAEIFPAR